MRFVDVTGLLHDVVLVVEFSSGVEYCRRSEIDRSEVLRMEGLLVPLGLSEYPEASLRVRSLANQISSSTIESKFDTAIADAIDAAFDLAPAMRSLKIDRSTRARSEHAWLRVLGESPVDPALKLYHDYFGGIFGLGSFRGVLIW